MNSFLKICLSLGIVVLVYFGVTHYMKTRDLMEGATVDQTETDSSKDSLETDTAVGTSTPTAPAPSGSTGATSSTATTVTPTDNATDNVYTTPDGDSMTDSKTQSEDNKVAGLEGQLQQAIDTNTSLSTTNSELNNENAKLRSAVNISSKALNAVSG